MIIVGVHAMASNMPVEYAEKQGPTAICGFNEALRRYARLNNILYMDTYVTTLGHSSFDGVHFGVAANQRKSEMILDALNAFRVTF